MQAATVHAATQAGSKLPDVRLYRRPDGGAGAPLPARPADLLGHLYRARGAAAGLVLPLAGMHPLAAFKGIDQASELLARQVQAAGHVLVVGDYDADGATGSALAVRGLRALGAARVSYLIPSRFAFGYGLSPAVVEAALPLCPDLILTVDNGIASVAGVARAAQVSASTWRPVHSGGSAGLPPSRG